MKIFLAMAILLWLTVGGMVAQAGRDSTSASQKQTASSGEGKGKSSSPKGRDSDSAKDASEGVVLRQTPFGLVKTKTSAAEGKPRRRSHAAHLMEVEEQGDTITFKRTTPFGPQVWTKKRSDLTPEDRELMKKLQESPPESESKAPAGAAGKPAAGDRSKEAARD